MKARRTIPKQVIEDVLVKSRRRCPLCFQAGDTESKIGSIMHLAPISKGGQDSFDNLVFLCSQHHNALDSRQGRDVMTLEEVKAARDKLYKAIEQEATSTSPARRSVFIVHGQDQIIRNEVSKFLKQLGLEPIILSEQPALGLSILEKLESNSDVKYAIVLLTADKPSQRKRLKENKASVRDNVLIELGYFMGRLGRNNVCALYQPKVELPSDSHGALYVELDNQGRWKRMLERELSHAGLPIIERYV